MARHLTRSCLKNTRIFLASQISNNVLSNPKHFSEDNIVRSKLSRVSVPNVPFEDYITNQFELYSNMEALECTSTGRKYTFSEIIQKSNALANNLEKSSAVNAGDVVAIISPNVPEYIITLLGVVRAGMKVTPVNPQYTPDEMAKQLMNSGAKMVFTLDEACLHVRKVLEISKLKIPIVGIKHETRSLPSGVIDFEEMVSGDTTYVQRLERKPDDVILLPYSSGTTGIPKGVEITNSNLVSALTFVDKPFIFPDRATSNFQDAIPAVLPMFHIYGLLGIKLMTYGSKLVTIPKFSSDSFYKTLETHKSRFAYIVPPMVLMMIHDPKFHTSLGHMEAILSGGAPLGSFEVDRIAELSGGKAALLQAYGMTETSGVANHQTRHLPGGIKPGGCGVNVYNTECKIVSMEDDEIDDDLWAALGPNESGELLIRGASIMKGYHANEEATKGSFVDGGWFRTGDVGHFDEDGHLFVTDRIKELIKVKGFQVAPAELEELLRKHPDVADAAVVGVPHQMFGEVPKAFVVLKKDKFFNASSIEEFVASRVIDYKKLAGGIIQLNAIPKSLSGKLLRKTLKNL